MQTWLVISNCITLTRAGFHRSKIAEEFVTFLFEDQSTTLGVILGNAGNHASPYFHLTCTCQCVQKITSARPRLRHVNTVTSTGSVASETCQHAELTFVSASPYLHCLHLAIELAHVGPILIGSMHSSELLPSCPLSLFHLIFVPPLLGLRYRSFVPSPLLDTLRLCLYSRPS